MHVGGIFCDLAKACYLNYIILAFREQWQIGSDPTLRKENKRLKNHLLQPKVST
jgi:hypothetical protein